MGKEKRNINKKESGYNKKLVIGVIIAAAILGASLLLAYGISSALPVDNGLESGTAMIIPVKGNLMTQSAGGVFDNTLTSGDLVDEIEQADQDSSIDGIILEVDSPGGSPVASHEVAEAVQETDKPTVSVIREVGASGSYWVASSADYIFSDELSITGSVGVLTNVVTVEGLLNDYNITYERIVGGEYKDIATPLRDVEPDERNELQRKIDLMHEFFLDDVTENRNLTQEQRANVSTGIFFVGLEAKDVGLVDEFGGIDEAETYLSNKTGKEISSIRKQRNPGLLSNVGSFFQNLKPDLFTQEVETTPKPKLR